MLNPTLDYGFKSYLQSITFFGIIKYYGSIRILIPWIVAMPSVLAVGAFLVFQAKLYHDYREKISE